MLAENIHKAFKMIAARSLEQDHACGKGKLFQQKGEVLSSPHGIKISGKTSCIKATLDGVPHTPFPEEKGQRGLCRLSAERLMRIFGLVSKLQHFT